MREYELVYILDPDLSEEAVNGLMTRFQTLATDQGAEIQSQERWEKRRLAYEIKDKREGIYVVMELNATPEAIHEMERILRITDGVLRHMTVRAEELRKAAKTGAPPAEESAPPTPAPEAPVAQAGSEAPGSSIPDTSADTENEEPEAAAEPESVEAAPAGASEEAAS